MTSIHRLHDRWHGPLLLASVVLTVLFATNEVRGQGNPSDALLHDLTERYQYVGVAGGYGFWWNDADFGVSDNDMTCARFTDGTGHGPAFDARTFFFPLRNKWFMFSPRVRYEARSGSFVTRLPDEPVRGEQNERVLLQQEAQVDATMATVTLEILVAAEIAETGVYVAAGGAGGILLEGVYDYTERILGPEGFVFSGTEDTEQTLIGGREFESFEPFVVDLRGGAGYMHRINDTWALNLEALYSYPVTSVFESPDHLKQQGVMVLFGLLYNVGL